MAKRVHLNLSRRERQIMDVIFQRGRATAAEVMGDLPDPPSYSAVRATLRILEKKGHVQHEQNGLRYVFVPTLSLNFIVKYPSFINGNTGVDSKPTKKCLGCT